MSRAFSLQPSKRKPSTLIAENRHFQSLHTNKAALIYESCEKRTHRCLPLEIVRGSSICSSPYPEGRGVAVKPKME
jgi:hypothetical protein